MFETISDRYDLLNDLLSLGFHRVWKRRLAALANVGASSRTLDLCCGTGDVAFALARNGAKVVGVDFSRKMLELAEQRAARSCYMKGSRTGVVMFVCADALRLPFADESFDVVTISYGLRNLASISVGICEMVRVTRTGGKVLVLDFGKPRSRFVRGCYRVFLRFIVPLFGKLTRGGAPAYAYIATSLEHYPAQVGIAKLMREQGMENVVVENFFGGAMSIHAGQKSRR